jgi:hypothetical protein
VFALYQRLAIEEALNDPFGHKRRPIRHMRNHIGIMADQQIGHAVLLLQPVQQIENFRLHRHIQRRGGLI